MWHNAFISYRRDPSFPMAQLIHDRLAEKGITSFLDLESLRGGEFEEKLYEAIENSDNFILILPKGALDNCVDPEDWMRKEIVAAVEKQKHMIPIMCEGFEWPRELYDALPEEVRSLEKKNAVKFVQDYLKAMIDRLVSFMTGVRNHIKESTEFISTKDFFEKGMKDLASIKMIDMAFLGGAEWHRGDDKVPILYALAEAGVHIRVLLNPADVSEPMAEHMRFRRKSYMKFDECIERWEMFAREFPENVEVRQVRIPLMRRYYSFYMKDSGNDSVNVKYYTYGNSRPDRNYQPIFYSGSDYFRLYRDEFDYLWEHAEKSDCTENE